MPTSTISNAFLFSKSHNSDFGIVTTGSSIICPALLLYTLYITPSLIRFLGKLIRLLGSGFITLSDLSIKFSSLIFTAILLSCHKWGIVSMGFYPFFTLFLNIFQKIYIILYPSLYSTPLSGDSHTSTASSFAGTSLRAVFNSL